MKNPPKRTPLPWAAVPAGQRMKNEYSQPFGIYCKEKYTLVAGVFGDVLGGEAEAKENADFIVTACNNHEAMRGMIDDFYSWFCEYCADYGITESMADSPNPNRREAKLLKRMADILDKSKGGGNE